MSPHTQKIWIWSAGLTCAVLLTVALAVLVFAGASGWNFLISMIWGAAASLIGLAMICQGVGNLSSSVSAEKNKGMVSYAVRYVFYALALLAGAWLKLNILGMLAGILAQKATLVIYALVAERTEKTVHE